MCWRVSVEDDGSDQSLKQTFLTCLYSNKNIFKKHSSFGCQVCFYIWFVQHVINKKKQPLKKQFYKESHHNFSKLNTPEQNTHIQEFLAYNTRWNILQH